MSVQQPDDRGADRLADAIRAMLREQLERSPTVRPLAEKLARVRSAASLSVALHEHSARSE